MPENKPQRVGVLVVHGIGEQHQFEHLEEIVRNVAAALQADRTLTDVQIEVNFGDVAAYLADQQTLRTGSVPTAIIEVKDLKNSQVIRLEFKELWWADLDEPTNLTTALSFWWWGLALWTRHRYDQRFFGTAKEDMRLPGSIDGIAKGQLPPEDSKIKPVHRLYLFLVSFVVLLTQPLLSLSGGILRNVLGLNLRPDIVVDFLGDVKLYQQDARVGRELLIDLGKHPPRTSIRRRLIKALVQMSLHDYDRWYLLSHSLGTLVAFNGLMETETALPNYLNRDLWKKWCRKFPNHRKTNKRLTEEEQKKMLPKRPDWLDPDDVIDRGQLFSKLKGFMTYGSPLSKFAVLWPAIVAINNDESVFREDFEWINVFDPTDPVSDFTRFFNGKTQDSRLTPQEVAYKAEQLHLLSHVRYFTFKPNRKNPLVKQVAQWLISGDPFKVPSPQDQWGWPQPKSNGKDSFVVWLYFNLGVLIWILFGAVMSIALSFLVPGVLPDDLSDVPLPDVIADKLLPWKPTINSFLANANTVLSQPVSYVVLAGIAVLGVGIVARLSGSNKNNPTVQLK